MGFFLELTAWAIATDVITRRLELEDLGSERSDLMTLLVGRLDKLK